MEQADAETAAEEYSSQIYDLMGIRGKVTEGGALPMPCSDEFRLDPIYWVTHGWSVYEISGATQETAMNNLREKVGEAGWDDIEYRETNSRARNMELTATHAETGYMPESYSSRIYDLMGIQGKVTEGGALPIPCTDDFAVPRRTTG
ncbi:hypothetical protein [Allostreptomyces psammosilenae]|uniref:Uncharacterized protein n=1 Tax=Allostreptomyces psammosilenae TaxID=1892865 RepID=A0A852ZZS7_9ACTN|nr:hypothetical protein [Allostreptomyces psammosilenae]NYI07836.1 hypothetical protein [Allostreptomyces psammosilenae]